jgi:SPP1 gp7 family putative phage head morphogenesis protein
MDPYFWTQESQILYEILFPLVQEAAVSAALASYTELASMVELGLSWQVVNQMAIDWANNYTTQVVSQISKTSMAAFLEKFQPWMLSGEPLPVLIGQLEPFYGEARASMIAITEITRAFASGNVLFWESTGMVTGYNFRTAQDDLVCGLCDGLTGAASRNPHRLDDEEDMPPKHVKCRCSITPVIITNKVGVFNVDPTR